MSFGKDFSGLRVRSVDSVVDTFIAWAGGPGAVRMLRTPDVVLAVHSGDRRGFLIDEIYFATLWADRGGSQLEADLRQSLAALGEDQPELGGIETNPHDLIEAVMQHGRRLG